MKPIIEEIPMAYLLPLLEEGLSRGKTVELIPTGTSMQPMLHHREGRVRLNRQEPIRGDVVLYKRRSGQFVLHRIVRVERDGTYTFCGDNQWALERGICPDQIVGVMTHFMERDGTWHSRTEPAYIRYWKLHLLKRPLRKGISRARAYAGAARRRIKKLWKGREAG